MTVSIKYHASIKNETIYSYTYWWATDFGDIASESGGSKYSIYSAGPTPPTVGLKLAIQSSSPHSKAAIVMESKGMHAARVMEADGINLSGVSPAIPGKSEGLEFGEYLIPIPYADLEDPQFHQLQLEQVQLKFSGLAISDDIDISMFEVIRAMLINDYYPSNVDLAVYGLLRGSNTSIVKILQSQGVDVNTPFKDLAIASQFDVMNDMPVIEAVGANDENEILLVA